MIIINLPESGFDPTEATIPWHFLTNAGVKVLFATPNKKKSHADERMLSQGVGFLSPLLMTRKPVLKLYSQMIETTEFKHPLSYDEISTPDIIGMILPGGHGEGMQSMLEAEVLYKKIIECFEKNKIIGALCTGVLTVARSIDPKTQKSVLFNRKTTAITKWMELLGWYLTRHFLKDYYHLYPTTAEDEIKKILKNPNQFFTGNLRVFPMQYTNKMLYGQFTVVDGNYLSGRWEGDCYKFALDLLNLVAKNAAPKTN